MLKKVTTIIAQNKDAIRQKALVLGGITTGMIISALLTKTTAPDVVVIETLEDAPVEPTSEEQDTTPES